MRRGRRLGPLLLSTTAQASNGPRIDTATAVDEDGRRYRGIVLGTGRRAPVIAWRGAGPGLPLYSLPRRVPAALQPAARWLFSMRSARG